MAKSTVIFVFLEYLIGFSFAAAGIFIFFEYDKTSSLMTGVFYTVIIGFVCMLVGIVSVGYFHLKAIRSLDKFAKALMFTFLGLLLFLLLLTFIDTYLPNSPLFSIIIPLTGGVMGFNMALTNK